MRFLIFLFLVGCTPEPQNVPCSNDGECSAKSAEYRFCAESRCVECVGRGSCDGHACVQGRCSAESIPKSH